MSNFFNESTEKGVRAVLEKFMENVLKRRIIDEPWDYDDYMLKLPFHTALVPEEIWKGAKFERSFVTSLGMIGWEEISRIIAEGQRGYASRNERIIGTIKQDRLVKIQQILRELEHGNRKPNWESEIKEILDVKDGSPVRVVVVADLYAKDVKKDELFAFEIKSPKPNSDQTQVSKSKILQLMSLEEPKLSGAYFALPFNPYGENQSDYGHPHPFRWFNMKTDAVVLMGKSFWDLLGGDGTYNALIEIFKEVGESYRDKIKKEYLGIE